MPGQHTGMGSHNTIINIINIGSLAINSNIGHTCQELCPGGVMAINRNWELNSNQSEGKAYNECG